MFFVSVCLVRAVVSVTAVAKVAIVNGVAVRAVGVSLGQRCRIRCCRCWFMLIYVNVVVIVSIVLLVLVCAVAVLLSLCSLLSVIWLVPWLCLWLPFADAIAVVRLAHRRAEAAAEPFPVLDPSTCDRCRPSS